MLESHNDTAVAIAEYVAGSVQHFAVQMNERAAELGCLDTHFVTPNGLDKSDEGGAHQTTAYDLSRIMAACIHNENLKIDPRYPSASAFPAHTLLPIRSYRQHQAAAVQTHFGRSRQVNMRCKNIVSNIAS